MQTQEITECHCGNEVGLDDPDHWYFSTHTYCSEECEIEALWERMPQNSIRAIAFLDRVQGRLAASDLPINLYEQARKLVKNAKFDCAWSLRQWKGVA